RRAAGAWAGQAPGPYRPPNGTVPPVGTPVGSAALSGWSGVVRRGWPGDWSWGGLGLGGADSPVGTRRPHGAARPALMPPRPDAAPP
ncbi:hypothetical protein ABZX91_34400, partial [Streptomyces coeruleorubidus]